MKKLPLQCFILIDKFSKHKEFKPLLLKEFENQNKQINNHVDNIYNLDWPEKNNTERPWIKLLLESFNKQLDKMAFDSGYTVCNINEMWFQQYIDGNIHDWHTHGSNFTGVYYVELDKNSPITNLVTPFSQNELIVPDVTEGDIIIFPSFTIHKAPLVTNGTRKTIISFNIDFQKCNINVYNQINNIL